MDGFNFVFSLFGLLLGLSLVEVLSGLIRLFQARGTVRIGWLTPMLGLIVMLDLTTFWSVAWYFRDRIHPALLTLVIGLLVSSIYYFGASLVTPRQVVAGTDLDEHYLSHRREVLGAVIAANVVVVCSIIGFIQFLSLREIFMSNMFVVPMVAAILSRRRDVNLAALTVTLSVYAFFIIGAAWGRG